MCAEAAWLPLAAEEGGFRVWGSSARLAALLRASEEMRRAVVGRPQQLPRLCDREEAPAARFKEKAPIENGNALHWASF